MKRLNSISRSPEPSASGAPVPGYALTCPTERNLSECLCRAFGVAAGTRTWSLARAMVCDQPGIPLSVEQLQRAAAVLEAQGGVAGTIARAFGIRVRAYLLLAGMRPVEHGEN